MGQLTGHAAEEPVVMYPEVCIHEVLPETSPVMQATGWRIVLTWVMAPPVVPLHAVWRRMFFYGLRGLAGSVH